MSSDQLPIQLVDFMQNGCQEKGSTESSDGDWDCGAEAFRPPNEPTPKKCYHALDVHRNPIVLVDSRDKFNRMLTLLSGEPVIAFDAEWKPISTSTSDVALIQLATDRCVYLIDVVVNDFATEDWNRLATGVFDNLEILKLGKLRLFTKKLLRLTALVSAYSPMADLKMFQRIMPAITLTAQTLQSYLDLQLFWQKLSKISSFKFPFEGTISSSALG